MAFDGILTFRFPAVGDFALKVAEACGAQAEDVQEIAATAVIEGMSSSWSRADTALVGDVKARGFGDLRRH
ncbi:unnamed protein product [Durusdinium trenchii]|uniref:Uncharacterized protein n=1 Tax=Durusdinium trenchii TaxID=1381693 RepID=A0ABP0MQU0_9DINO